MRVNPEAGDLESLIPRWGRGRQRAPALENGGKYYLLHGMPAAAAFVLEIRRGEQKETIMGELGLAHCGDMGI